MIRWSAWIWSVKFCLSMRKHSMSWIWNGRMWFVNRRRNWLWRMTCCGGWSVNWWRQASRRNHWRYMPTTKRVTLRPLMSLSLIRRLKKGNPANWVMLFYWRISRNLRNWILPRLHLFRRYLMNWRLRLLLLWWASSCWKISVSVHWMMNRSSCLRVSRRTASVCWVSPENCLTWPRWKRENYSLCRRSPNRLSWSNMRLKLIRCKRISLISR